MLRNKDLISTRPATMKDVTEVAQAVLDTFGEVMMNVIDVCMIRSTDDEGRRDAARLQLYEALITARDTYREDEDIFAAALTHRLARTLHGIRVEDAESSDDH